MIGSMMRYGRQQLSEIDEWTVDELFLWNETIGKLCQREGLPDGG